MAIEIPRGLVEFILLGPEDDRRQLQDSPLLGDVWMKFANEPDGRLELLITPYKSEAAGRVAAALARETPIEANVAYLQGIVAASLTFGETLQVVIPKTSWFTRKQTQEAMRSYVSAPDRLRNDIVAVFRAATKWHVLQESGWPTKRATSETPMQDYEAHQRYVALAGLLLWAKDRPSTAPDSERILNAQMAQDVANLLAGTINPLVKQKETPLIWNVSMNRRASAAIAKSVPAVKADAAKSLFNVNCSKIVWAVFDSGIDSTHSAFLDKRTEKTRIKNSFDFTRIREIVSLSNASAPKAVERANMLSGMALKQGLPPGAIVSNLTKLAEGADEGRPIDWGLVEPLVEIREGTPPQGKHGTHVAGILGAKGVRAEGAAAGEGGAEGERDDDANGMCPDIAIYDFRVLAPTLAETEFAIMAALQFIRYVNERHSYLTIHGVNLSLSIPHEVRNYGCGQTPICNECERLVNSGVVVVAAAGNRGYQNFETKDGVFENYAAFSITDPGNADSVITVGSTHRFSPHTFGVSFFSSRGPTGDGRMKPDLVAPGERIRGPVPGKLWGDLDGTSMAAPHVSGAAAMLMARYPELVGQPRRVKQILCNSATDLARERSFQGCGMLDVLRAFQSI